MRIELVGTAWLGDLGGVVEPQCCRLSDIPKDKLQTALLGDRWGIEITPMDSKDASCLSAIRKALTNFQRECAENDITIDLCQSGAGWVMFGDFTKLREAYRDANIYPLYPSQSFTSAAAQKAITEYEQTLSGFFDTALSNLETTQATHRGRPHDGH